MIKTYRARVNRNNVSYLLYGKQGNEVRFNFTNGNVVTNKYPSLTLKGRYYQELLEDSTLFQTHVVIMEREQEEYPGEKAEREAETTGVSGEAETTGVSGEAETTNAEERTEASPKQVQIEKVPGIRTSDEVIAYVNERYGKECKTLATAMKHASKDGLVFPDFSE